MKNRKKEKNSKTPFFKIVATGNDFIFIDQRPKSIKKGTKRIAKTGRAQLAKKICDRHWGAGGDGLVFIERPQNNTADLKWDFYNSDGSMAEMCGNAARALGHLMFDVEKGQGPLNLETKAGVVEIKKSARGYYCATLPKVRLIKGQRTQSFLGKNWNYFLVNSGVPHAVVPLKQKTNKKILSDVAVELKKSKRLGSSGANVTFFWENKRGIEAITHERGVEDFTLSCGTGALAAAWVLKFLLGRKTTGRIFVPGGELNISLGDSPSGRAEIIGPAAMVARGHLYV